MTFPSGDVKPTTPCSCPRVLNAWWAKVHERHALTAYRKASEEPQR